MKEIKSQCDFIKYLLTLLLKGRTSATDVALIKTPIGYPIGGKSKID